MKKLTLIVLLTSFGLLTFSQTLTINFGFDQSHLDEKKISSITELIKTYKPKEVNLTGYADTIGTVGYNKLLVQRRLETVENALRKIDESIQIEKTNVGEEKSSSNEAEFRKVDISFPQITYQEKKPNYKKPQSFLIDNTKDTIIECVGGTKINIPQNSLIVKETKIIPQGYVKLQVAEYYEVHEMIDANLSTQSGDEILETGGMLYMRAWFKDKECSINDDFNIEIHFNNITQSDSMHLFTGNETEDGIDWELMGDLRENDSDEFLSEESGEIFLFAADVMPTFQGGDRRTFHTYVSSRLKYPAIAVENKIQGRVSVSFTVNELGLIQDPEIIKSTHPSLAYEVLRAIVSTPRWNPGTNKGQPVSVPWVGSFNFNLDGGLPIDKTNRINSTSELGTFIQNDSVFHKYDSLIQKNDEANAFKSEFYFRTNKLGWINCDDFYGYSNKGDIKIVAETVYESYFAVFNRYRSIMRPNSYNGKSKIRRFNKIPSNQNALIIGIKISNGETYFTSFNAKPKRDAYTPTFEKIDKSELIDKMKKLGL